MTKYQERKASLRETNLDKFLKFREDLTRAICKAYSRNPRATKHDFDESIKYLEEFGFFDKPSKIREGRLADIRQSSGFAAFKGQEEAAALATSMREQAAQLVLDYVEEQFDMFAEECQVDSAAELSVERDDDTVSFLLNDKVAFSFTMPSKALKYQRWTIDSDEGEIVGDDVLAQDLASGKVASCNGFGQVQDFAFTDRAVYAYYLVVTDFQRTWGFSSGDISISTPTVWKGDERKSPYSGYATALAFVSDGQAHLYGNVEGILPTVDDLFNRIKLDNTLLDSFDTINSNETIEID